MKLSEIVDDPELFKKQFFELLKEPPTPFMDEDGIKTSEELMEWLATTKYNNNWTALMEAAAKME